MKKYDPPEGANILTRTYEGREPDVRGRLKPTELVNMFADAAGKHARILGVATDSLTEEGVTWMLGRMSFGVVRWPAHDETVTVDTWPSGHDRVYAYRNFRFNDAAGEPFGGGSTAWLVVNIARRRPVRIKQFLLSRGLDFPDLVPDDVPSKLNVPGDGGVTARFDVKDSDIDFNGHVTSTSYVAWALATLPDETRDMMRLSHFDINYIAETLPGETAVSRAISGGDGAFDHIITEASDGRELARARTVWTKG